MSVDIKPQGPEFLPQKPFYNAKNKNVYSFGKSKMSRTMIQSEKEPLPGPGHYKSAKHLYLKKHPRCVIGSAKRVLGSSVKTTPGVGSYDVERILKNEKKKTGFSIGRKKRFKSLGVKITRKMSRK